MHAPFRVLFLHDGDVMVYMEQLHVHFGLAAPIRPCLTTKHTLNLT